MSKTQDDTPKGARPTDPYVEAQVERTLAPYKAITPPFMLETMREELRLMLTTDPNAVALLNQLRESGAPLATTERVKDGVEPQDEADSGEEGR
jgi:hypothetical protein